MNAPTKRKHEYKDKVSEAIDKVLRKIFGEEATLLIYAYLKTYHSLKPDEIAEKIDVFAQGLEEFLKSGANVIEKQILEDIYSNHDLTSAPESERRNEYDFVSQMKMLMQKV